MILSDRELRRRLQDGSIRVEPLLDLETQLQPASIDLRLGHAFQRMRKAGAFPVSIVEIAQGDDFVLQPGELALGSTLERIAVPTDLVARVEGRSSVGRLGVLVHATAGFIDPGFEGEITLELANLGPTAVRLRPEERVCQIVFQTMTSPAERPYGPERGSKYHGQLGPTPSRLEAPTTQRRE